MIPNSLPLQKHASKEERHSVVGLLSIAGGTCRLQLQITDELSGVNHNSITKYLVGLNRSRIRRGQYSADGLFASLVDSNLKFLYIPSRSTLSSSSWSRPDLAHEIVPLNSPRPTPALTHDWFVFFLFHAMEKLSKSYLSKKKLIIILSKLMKSPQTPRYGW